MLRPILAVRTGSRFAASTCHRPASRLASRRPFHTTRMARSASEDPLRADLKSKGIPIPENMPLSKFDYQAMLEDEHKKLSESAGGSIFPDSDGIHPNVKKVGDLVLSLNMIEMQQLSKYIQKKMGLSESAMAMMGGGMPMMGGGMPMMGGGMPMMGGAHAAPAANAAPAAAAAPEKEEPKVEKTEFDLKLEKFATDKKLQIIKELRVANKELGIKEAKELVESAPCVLLKNLKKDDANKWKAKFEELGGTMALV